MSFPRPDASKILAEGFTGDTLPSDVLSSSVLDSPRWEDAMESSASLANPSLLLVESNHDTFPRRNALAMLDPANRKTPIREELRDIHEEPRAREPLLTSYNQDLPASEEPAAPGAAKRSTSRGSRG